ncbi:MAG: phage/plasmid primase, P4 family [Methanoregula sp.]
MGEVEAGKTTATLDPKFNHILAQREQEDLEAGRPVWSSDWFESRLKDYLKKYREILSSEEKTAIVAAIWTAHDREPAISQVSDIPVVPQIITPSPLSWQRDLASRKMVFTDQEEGRQTRLNLACRELPRSDLGNSQRFAVRFGRDIRYCHPFKSWYIFNGQRWVRDDKGAVVEYGKECVLRLADEASLLEFNTEQAAGFKWAGASQAHGKITGMLDLAKGTSPIIPDEFDSNPDVLNSPNGTLDLVTMEFREHDRNDLISKVTGCNYNPAAKCPKWEIFMQEIMGGNQNLIGYLQRAAGYSLTGRTGERALFLCHGGGMNGKSTFLNVLLAVLREYGIPVEASTFCVSRNESVRNDLAALKGARLVTATEAGKGKRLDESIIKQLTGGEDKIRARFLFQEYFEFKPSCKIWWAFNSAPRITDSTDSIWTRVKMIPFSVIITEAKRDVHLHDKLLQESEGILVWMLAGLKEYQRIGLTEPEEVKEATQRYREEQDSLADFFNDECLIEPGITSGATELYNSYVKWMNTEAPEDKIKSQRAFGFEMNDHGFKRDRDQATRKWIYHGIRLKRGGF